MAKTRIARKKRARPLKKPFPKEVAEALKKLESPKDHIRLEGIVALELRRDKRVVPAVVRLLKREHFEPTRVICIGVLRKVGDRRALPALKKAVFDFDRNVRGCAADTLATFVGWKNVTNFIRKRFRSPGEIPRAFFPDSDYVGGKRKILKWRKRDWRAVRKQAAIDARKNKLVRMKDKNGKPFSINNMPVFLSELRATQKGLYDNGVLIVQRDPKRLDPRDREPIVWHEFGEIFSHEVGLAFELDFLKRTRQLEGHLKRNPWAKKDFKEIEEDWIKKK